MNKNILDAVITSFHQSDALSVLTYLLDSSDEQDRYGWNSLHVSALFNATLCVELLLVSTQCNINQRDRFGKTPLHIAAQFSGEVIVKSLLEKGANVNDLTNAGQSPLCIALQFGNIPAIKIICRYVNQLDLLENKTKILISAMKSKSITIIQHVFFDLEIVELNYLEKLALSPKDLPDQIRGFIFLYLSYQTNDPQIEFFLAQHMNDWGNNDSSFLAITKLLVYFSRFNTLFEIIEKLAQPKKDIILPKIITYLWKLNIYLTSHKLKITKTLTTYCTDTNELNVDGNYKSLLMLAAEIDEPILASFVFNKPPGEVRKFLTHADKNGNTLLHYCAQHQAINLLNEICNSKFYRKILSRYVNKRNCQLSSALHVAIKNNSPKIVELLIIYLGADVLDKNFNNDTALHLAIWKGNYGNFWT